MMADGLSTALFRRDPEGTVHARHPRLLVSVRDVDEAQAALSGGADIVDIKEPERGALGMADPAVINDIVASIDGRVPVSAALGELREWTTGLGFPLRSDGLSTALPRLSFIKLGLAGCGSQRDWFERWIDLREWIDAATRSALPWVAVAYADARSADAPAIIDVIDAAVATGCRGVLIDTFDKQSGSLLDCCARGDLLQFANAVQSQGLFIAFAGRLSAAQLDRPGLHDADVIGVRSAACAHGDRQQRVSSRQVADLRSRLNASSPQSIVQRATRSADASQTIDRAPWTTVQSHQRPSR